MNKDIKIMVELQRYFDAISESESKIRVNAEKLSKAENEISQLKIKIDSMDHEIKETKNAINQHELELADLEGRAKKLEDRKTAVHNEKELHAVEKELSAVKDDISAIEEKILAYIDELEEKQHVFIAEKEELSEYEKNLFSEKTAVSDAYKVLNKSIEDNRSKFDGRVGELSSIYSSKFLKLLQSKGGKAIAPVDGEFCGNCNFKIPTHLVSDASKDDTATVCTNCGRFIFK